MRKFGLIGFPLGHSFSKKYFTEKFSREGIQGCQFELYPIARIQEFPQLFASEPSLEGLSVTIPYKEQVISYLDGLDPACAQIGAVNCIRIRDGKKIGFNTDYLGFKQSLQSWLGNDIPNALVLGTGGASKAVQHSKSSPAKPKGAKVGTVAKSTASKASSASVAAAAVSSTFAPETSAPSGREGQARVIYNHYDSFFPVDSSGKLRWQAIDDEYCLTFGAPYG